MGFQEKFNLVYSASLIPIFIFLSIQLILMRGREGFSPFYLPFYPLAGLLCIIIVFKNFVFDFKGSQSSRRGMLDYGFTAETSKDKLLSKSNNYKQLMFRISPFILFLLVIILSATSNFQLVPVPQAFQEGFAASEIQKGYFSSIPVGLIEDFITLELFSIIVLVLNLLFKKVFKISSSFALTFGTMIIAALIASSGYGLFPGFASAHGLAYQSNQGAFILAFLFQFMNLLIFGMTGLFLPIAHITHNFLIVTLFTIVAFSIGNFVLIPLTKKIFGGFKNE